MRMSKICAGLQVLQGPMTVKLNNLSAMECNIVRPFFQGSLAQFQALAGVCTLETSALALLVQSMRPSAKPERCVANRCRPDRQLLMTSMCCADTLAAATMRGIWMGR